MRCVDVFVEVCLCFPSFGFKAQEPPVLWDVLFNYYYYYFIYLNNLAVEGSMKILYQAGDSESAPK